MNRILVIAAHPDDEILGVGATIMKHVQNGSNAEAIILGEGQTSRSFLGDNLAVDLVEQLHDDTRKAGKIIGYSNIHFSRFPDNRFDRVDLLDIIKVIEQRLKEYKPDIIYTHHGGDLNIDHRRTFQAVLTATRPIGDYCVKEIYAFETLSSTEWNFSNKSNVFLPNVFQDVSEYIEQKCQAMKQYQTELCEFPHPRSIEGIQIAAKKWGSVAGVRYAEAFELIRMVQ